MKKIFKGFRFKNFIINELICLAYPIIRAIKANNSMLVFSDTSLIISLVFIVGGTINTFIRSGDFDITSFIATRSITKNKNLTFEKYKEDKTKEREDNFNYLLLVGIITLIISFIAATYA